MSERKTDAAASPANWMMHWRRIARRIRVPLGFVAAGVYLWRLVVAVPHPVAILGSILLVVPGLWLRGYAAGYVKKNQELTQTGPYAYTRNPLYLGSILVAAGFAVALMHLWFALILAAGFLAIYVPVIAGEEAFLRSTFPDYDAYCQRVPRLLPRLRAHPSAAATSSGGRFSFDRYRQHREYRSLLGVILLYASLIAAYLLHGHWPH